MSTDILDRECALRIALAKKVLPGIELPRLLEVIIERIGAPITVEALAAMTVKDLRMGLKRTRHPDVEQDECNSQSLEMAVRYLSGEREVEPDLPAVEAFGEDEMPGSIRIALASNTGDQLDGHFGSCARFLIYQVSHEAARLVEIRFTEEADKAEDRNAARAQLLADCQLLYVESIGGPAAAKVIRVGVHPIKLPDGPVASEVIARLQAVLEGTPPPWLAKVMGREPGTVARFGEG